MLVYFDKDLAIAPVIELICQLDFNESPLITLEPTEEELNNEIVIVDTSYNIQLSTDIILGLFKDDHYPQKLLWILVPCEWQQRIGIENSGRVDVQLAELCALAQPEIVYVQRPQSVTDAIANYMMIACGMFMQAGKNLLEMPLDLQNEICGRAIQYALPTSLNTDQVLDSEFVFEVNVVLQHIL